MGAFCQPVVLDLNLIEACTINYNRETNLFRRSCVIIVIKG